MPRDLTLYLVRHGESEANLDRAVNASKADHLVTLTPLGHTQAAAAGAWLAQRLHGAHGIAAYVSPYLRTRQTWEQVRAGLLQGGIEIPEPLQRESVFLREIEFGLFDGIADEELPKAFPNEHSYYEKLKPAGGEYYARMPCGESRCDVAQRVHQCFGTIHRDAQRHGVRHAIIVSHGVTLRALAMMWMGKTVEWVAAERNPHNCSIRIIESGEDQGYGFAGFNAANPARERREDAAVD